MRAIVILVMGVISSACTSIQVKNATGFNVDTVQQVCIVHNPKVTIRDFDRIVENSFSRHQVEAKTYESTDHFLNVCQTKLEYTALRSWDFKPYMVYAEFRLFRNGQMVSESSFNLKGKGGLALNKWRSTETKIDELVDQLLNKTAKQS